MRAEQSESVEKERERESLVLFLVWKERDFFPIMRSTAKAVK